jgi:uncharacterized membrane protein YphA (DoxX/SURF4 family)
MLAGIFVVQGIEGLTKPDPLIPAAQRMTDRISPVLRRIHPSLPGNPRTLVQLDQAAKVIGGVALVTALRRPAALVLACSMVPTTLAAHSFWESPEPAGRAQQRVNFLKNISIIGGLILAAADTEGRPGMRWRTAHTISDTNRSLRHKVQVTRVRARLAAHANPIGRHLRA